MPKKTWYEMKALAVPGAAEVFIYDEIGDWGVTSDDFRKDLKALGDVSQIELHINSPGGSVMHGTAIYNLLNNHPASITVYIDGWACSMGSLIAMVGDEIHMPSNALMMIHNPSRFAAGESSDLRKAADMLDKAKEAMVGSYMKRTGKTEEEISQIMDEETWYTGAEAVEQGFADVLTAELDMTACAEYDLAAFGFNKVPESFGGGSAKPAPTKPAAVAAKPETNGEHEMLDPNKETATAEAIAAAKKDAQAAEQKRRDGIRAAFKGHEEGNRELMDACMDDFDCTVENAQAKLLNALGNKETPLAAGQGARVLGDGDAKYRDDVVNAVGIRAGIIVPSASISNPLAGMSLYQFACMALDRIGMSYGGMGKQQIVGMAFQHTSSDFGDLLANVAQKAMLKGFEEAEETFQLFTSKGVLTDFKTAKRAGLGAFGDLDEVPEGGEFKHGSIADRGENVQLATYGKLFALTRQTIINDDLDAFTKIPRTMGRAAKRTIGNKVFDVIKKNPLMADGKELFHADHGNLLTGAGITTSSVSAARAAMKKQKDGGAALNIPAKFLLCGVENEDQANIVRSAEHAVGGDNKQTIPNSVRNSFEVVADARMDDAPWAMASDPMMTDGIEVQYLDGIEEPRLEQQAGWNIDGTEYKVAIDAGVKALDHRGLVYNPGQ